jgi:hypothetical protein
MAAGLSTNLAEASKCLRMEVQLCVTKQPSKSLETFVIPAIHLM